MVHIVSVRNSITAERCARVYIDMIFRLPGRSRELVSGRDPWFTTDLAIRVPLHRKRYKILLLTRQNVRNVSYNKIYEVVITLSRV